LGKAYYAGLGVPRDYKESLKWLHKAEKNGNIDAACRIGKIYRKGLGVDACHKKAMEWFLKGYHKGNKMATMCLGQAYLYGTGVKKDINVAEKYFKVHAQGNY
jgi:TPR repeat protein